MADPLTLAGEVSATNLLGNESGTGLLGELPSFGGGGGAGQLNLGLLSVPISALNPTATAEQYYLPTVTQSTQSPFSFNLSQVAGPGNQANASIIPGLFGGSSGGGGGGNGGSNYADVTQNNTLVPPNLSPYSIPTPSMAFPNAPAQAGFTPATPMPAGGMGIPATMNTPYAQMLGQSSGGNSAAGLAALALASQRPNTPPNGGTLGGGQPDTSGNMQPQGFGGGGAVPPPGQGLSAASMYGALSPMAMAYGGLSPAPIPSVADASEAMRNHPQFNGGPGAPPPSPGIPAYSPEQAPANAGGYPQSNSPYITPPNRIQRPNPTAAKAAKVPQNPVSGAVLQNAQKTAADQLQASVESARERYLEPAQGYLNNADNLRKHLRNLRIRQEQEYYGNRQPGLSDYDLAKIRQQAIGMVGPPPNQHPTFADRLSMAADVNGPAKYRSTRQLANANWERQVGETERALVAAQASMQRAELRNPAEVRKSINDEIKSNLQEARLNLGLYNKAVDHAEQDAFHSVGEALRAAGLDIQDARLQEQISHTNLADNLHRQAEAFKESSTNQRIAIAQDLEDLAESREERAEEQAPGLEKLTEARTKYYQSGGGNPFGGAAGDMEGAVSAYRKKYPHMTAAQEATLRQTLSDAGVQ